MVDSKHDITCAVIGECMLELSSMTPSSFGLKDLNFGGDTLNSAIYMARQHVSVQFISALGDDHWSDAMLAQWHAEGIDVTRVSQVPGRLPALYAIQTDDAGERKFFYWRQNSPARELFKHHDAEALLQHLISCDYIYLSGITLSLYDAPTLDCFADFFTEYRKVGGKLVFDSNYRPNGWQSPEHAICSFEKIIPSSHMVLPTLDDEQLLRPGTTLESCIEYYQSMGVEEVVVKRGAKGCTIAEDSNRTNVATLKVVPVDTTAAGDSFNGTYIAERMKGKSSIDAAKTANQVAGLVVQSPGAILKRA